MQSFTVIEDLQVFKQVVITIEVILPSGMVDQFGFEQMEEGLGNGIVPTVALATHALHQAVSLEQGSEGLGRILDPPVGMDDQSLGGPPAGQGLLQGLEHQLLAQGRTHCPTHHPARIQVNEDRQVDPALLGGQIGDVPHPHLVGTGDGEATLQQVGGYRFPMRGMIGIGVKSYHLSSAGK